ncbi:50S ribosomal protein L21 [Candidatus Saccharibacteria bacterium]|nr:50S ribosomal protein L21 [Candidatus Saccharibacteria bacterium]
MDEERKGDVQTGTLTASRSPQRRNAGVSTDELSSSAAQASPAVRKSGKKAVILTGGHQYLISEGDELEVEKLATDKKPEFEALLVIDGENISVGTPSVAGVKVTAEVTEAEVKADKVIAIRYKAKKRVDTRRGHRQKLTRIKITKISTAVSKKL